MSSSSERDDESGSHFPRDAEGESTSAATNDLSASKQPYPHRKLLYLMHFAFSFTSRMWDMGIVLFVAIVTHNSLFVIALAGLISSMSIFVFMPAIGPYLDKINRFTSAKISLTVKIIAITLSYGVCGIAEGIPGNTVNGHYHYSPIILIVPFLCGIVSLSFSTIVQCIEKDWIVVLSNGDSQWLSGTNSFMSQIDLAAASIAPLVTGFLFSFLTSTEVAISLLLLNALTTVLLFNFMKNLYNSWPALAIKVSDINIEGKQSTSSTNGERGKLSAQEIVDFSDNEQMASPTWTAYLNPRYCCLKITNAIESFCADFSLSGCAGTMYAYSFLYFTVLSFGSLMTVYLRWAGLSDYWIGLARGCNALMGFFGAWVFPSFNARFGLWKTGQIAITYQVSLVVLAAASFAFADRSHAVVVVVLCTLFSRCGLWMFDLAARQICQETIPEAVRGKVNGQWRSIIAFFDMMAYVMATIFPDPRQFYILTTISACMVVSALITFSYNNPEVDLRAPIGYLFPDYIKSQISTQYQNLFVNSGRTGTGIDISQHELADNKNNSNDNDDMEDNLGSSSSSSKSSNNSKSIEMTSGNKYSTGKKKLADVDDVEEITL
jgi:iron-regulated transporter 1